MHRPPLGGSTFVIPTRFLLALVVLITFVSTTHAATRDIRQELYEQHAVGPRSDLSKWFENFAFGFQEMFRTPPRDEMVQRAIDDDYDHGHFHYGPSGMCSICKKTVGEPGGPTGVIWAPGGDVRLSCGHVFCESCSEKLLHCPKCDPKESWPGTFPELSSVPASMPLRFWTPEDHVGEDNVPTPTKQEESEGWSSEVPPPQEQREEEDSGFSEESGSGTEREDETPEEEAPVEASREEAPVLYIEEVIAEKPMISGGPKTGEEPETMQPQKQPEPTATTTPARRSQPIYSYAPPQASMSPQNNNICSYCGGAKQRTEISSLLPLGEDQYVNVHGSIICEKCACRKHACQKPECQRQEMDRLNRLRGAVPLVNKDTRPQPEAVVEKESLPELEDETVEEESPPVDLLEGATARKHLGPHPLEPRDWNKDTEDMMRNQKENDIVRPYNEYIPPAKEPSSDAGDTPTVLIGDEVFEEEPPVVENREQPIYEGSEYLDAESQSEEEPSMSFEEDIEIEPEEIERPKKYVPVTTEPDIVAPVKETKRNQAEYDNDFDQLCARCKRTVFRYYADNAFCERCRQRQEKENNAAKAG